MPKLVPRGFSSVVNEGASEGEKRGLPPQKYLGRVGLVVLIALLSMTSQLGTDLYMPAMPAITEHLNTTNALTSLTMTVFFISMAVGMLLIGPISDKFGRKPVLVASSGVSFAMCIACALAWDIYSLLAFRVVHGFAAGGMCAVSTALIRDCFTGRLMAVVLSVTQAIGLFAPVLAPLIGSFVLSIGGWQAEFVTLAILVGLSLLGSILFSDTLPPERRVQGGVFQSLAGLGTHARNKSFMLPVIINGLMSTSYMCYLGVASYVYIDDFGISETMFGLLFAVAAIAAAIGPLVYMRSRRVRFCRAVEVSFVVAFVVAALLVFVAKTSPFVFMACMIPYLFAITFTRPMTTKAVLMLVDEGAGAASSLVNCTLTAIGCVGMTIVSSQSGDYLLALGTTMVITAVLSVILWFAVARKASANLEA